MGMATRQQNLSADVLRNALEKADAKGLEAVCILVSATCEKGVAPSGTGIALTGLFLICQGLLDLYGVFYL